MFINETDRTLTAVILIRPGRVAPAGAVVLAEDNPHVCLSPDGGPPMRCPACEMKEMLGHEVG